MNATDYAGRYLRLGISPIPLPYQSKKPTLRDWPNLRITPDDLDKYFNGSPLNIGGLLGTPSNGIVSVDCDWPEAGLLAKHLLPASWTFGRNGQWRHVLVRSPGAKSTAFDAPPSMAEGEKRRIVEILSTGKQCMLPGSVHPSGESVRWITAPSKAELAELPADQLLSRVSALAGAARLVRLWPDLEGTRHDVALALAGALHHAGWPITRIQKLLIAVLATADDPERLDRGRAAADTLARAEAGEPVTGLPRLSELLPADALDCLVKWWNLGSSGPQLTFNGQPAPQPMNAQPIFANDWPELLMFEEPDFQGSATPYPVRALGKLLGNAVQAIVDRQQVPEALAAQSVLSAAGTAAQGHHDVECDGRILPLSLWLAYIGAPGERKTSTDDVAFARLYLRMREATLRYQTTLTTWKAARANKDEGDPGPRPRNPTWLLRDATAEGLLKTLDRHWPALTLTNSDAAAWLAGYSMREGRDSATAATLSALWSGTFHAQARASLDEPSTLHNRRLSLSLMLQPELAAQLFESRTLAGQGFLSRCLPAFPPSTIGTRKYRRAQSDERLDAFYEAQDRLLLHPPDMVLETGDLQLKALPLADDALSVWIEYHDHFEQELAGEYRDIREVANKMPEQILRLAGVRAALEGLDHVTREQIDDAATLVFWYAQEWLSMSGRLVAHRRDVALPKALLDWMRQRRFETGETVFNLRDIYRSGPRMVRNQADHTRGLMTELIRRGYARVVGKDYELRPEADL